MKGSVKINLNFILKINF